MVFQISARMMIAIALGCEVSGAELPNSADKYPVLGVQAYSQLNAAATVTIP